MRCKANGRPDYRHALPNICGEVCTFDCAPFLSVVVACQRNVAGGSPALYVCHVVKETENRTACWMAAASCSNGFSFNAVLLRGEHEGDVVGALEEGEWVLARVQSTFISAKGDVAQSECVRCVVLAGAAVFTWSHEEVEGNPDEVGNALLARVASAAAFVEVVKNGCWDGFDALRRRILSFVAAKLP